MNYWNQFLMILFEVLISTTLTWLAWACALARKLHILFCSFFLQYNIRGKAAPFSFWHEQGHFPFGTFSTCFTKIKRDYFYEVLKPKSNDPFWSINSNYFCSKWLTFIFACEGTISFYFIHYFVFNWIADS